MAIGDKRECSGLLVHAFIYLSSFARIDLIVSSSALFHISVWHVAFPVWLWEASKSLR
jgi:hypothetical protein